MRPGSARPLLVSTLLLLAWPPGLAQAEGPAPAESAGAPLRGRVAIAPGQEEELARMLGRGVALPGRCRWAGASIDRASVTAAYECGAERQRVEVELRHPDDAPVGAERGARFAVVPRGSAAPPKELVPALIERLDAQGAGFRWQQIATPSRRDIGAAFPGEVPWPAHRAWLLAAALVLAPLSLGALAGGPARRLSGRALGARCLALLLLPLPLGAALAQLSIHDVGAFAGLFTLALALRARWPASAPLTAGRAGLLAASLSASLFALELTARSLPLSLPPVEPVGAMHLVFPPRQRDRPCAAVYPEQSQGPWFVRFQEPLPVAPPQPGVVRVVHIGDSMTEGSDVPADAMFTSQMDRLRPGEEHLNLGISGTGTDVHLLVLEQWLPRLKPGHVYLHVFPGNDVAEVNRPYACCDDGPLLQQTTSGPEPRCPSPRWRLSLARLLRQGPAPYPLRVLSSKSEAARQLTFLLERRLMPRFQPAAADSELPWSDFDAALRAFGEVAARAGVPLTVVVLPVRMAFDGTNPAREASQRETSRQVLERARAAGLRTLDAGAYFEELYRRDPRAPLFKRDSQNGHFDSLGHLRYAEWLAEQQR